MIIRAVSSFILGAIFATGLAISGMTQPLKIIGFLDVFGSWDHSLVFVLATAVGVYYIMFQLITQKRKPILANRFLIPTRTDINFKSIAGALIFGVGWGISGLCPGPVFATLATGTPSVFLLVIFLIIGLYTASGINRLK